MSPQELQVQYELEQDADAAARRLQELTTAAKAGDVSAPRAHSIIARMHGEVAELLSAEAAVMTRGIGGKYKSWLRKIDPNVAALIALRECLSQCSAVSAHSVTAQSLCTCIGQLYETEVRVKEADVVNPMYMQKIHEQIKDRCTTSKSHLRNVFNTAYDRVMKGEIESELTRSELLMIGKYGVNACIEVGLIEINRTVGSRGHLIHYTLTEELREYLHGYTHKDVLTIVDRASGAMLCKPEEWTNLADGGYITPRRKMAYPLMNVRGIRKSERARVVTAFTSENMPTVFKVANYLQGTAFSVHKPTFDAVLRVWGTGGGVLGVPTKSGPTEPVFPFNRETWAAASAPEDELAVFHAWKRSMVRWYDALRTWRGKVREIGGFIKVSSACPEEFWFPMYMDKRGRWYYRGTPNPQGSDMAKAVLHFHDKKPLGATGVYWLKVHIANSYGFDKERFDERARWTEQNWDTIQAALDEPENHPDVWGKDAPWCMFSAAWELREAYRTGNPAGYACGIPVHMDATCSGLQHFSAMLRDPVGARYVNLTDELQCGPKQDIYGRVATLALHSIQRDLESADEAIRAMAAWWIQTGIDRALAKKPVMTYVYGATLKGTAEFVQDYIECEKGIPWPQDARADVYARYCAKKLFQGIAGAVPAAAEAMRWLREIAQQQPNGKRMEWVTPTGFVVQHDYQGYDEVRIKLRSCGLTDVLIRNWNNDTQTIKMQNAISPNFVHALDAAHITLTASAMQDAGLSMVGIHDSFGTHACDVPSMHKILREQFVQMYSRNMLGEFLWDVGATSELPQRGNLELSQVLDSEFFFS